jgi:hypothetical protein
VARKERADIPEEVAALVLYRAERTCCVCREARKAVQIHHIDENPANNDPENLSVLCLQCHNDTQVRGGFGRKLDAAQVRRFREEWAKTVENRRALLTPIDSVAGVGDREREHDTALFKRAQDIMSEEALNRYIQPLWDDHSAYENDQKAAQSYVRFWSTVDDELIDPELGQRCEAMRNAFEELFTFVAHHFFVSDMPGETVRRYVMHPGLNIDRGGRGRPDEMDRYQAYQEQLESLLAGAWTAWKEFRRAVKRRLIL